MTATQERPRISELVKGYRYPRTVAELIKLRREQFEARPEQLRVYNCSRGHGTFLPRPLQGQTYEQLYCGLWWDCEWRGAGDHLGCAPGVIIQSRDMCYDHGEPYHNGYGWEKFTPDGWVEISDEEAGQFRAALKAWDEARQPKPKRTRKRAAHRHAQALPVAAKTT